jgi:hypothetical protein
MAPKDCPIPVKWYWVALKDGRNDIGEARTTHEGQTSEAEGSELLLRKDSKVEQEKRLSESRY